jgi:CDP-diacylglycerol---serine O-phosphatidyltransferase
MKITRAVVPSLFTVLNMFSGFMSILHASHGEFIAASWFIALAAGFDALDGVMARITRSSSQFGVEIDSLSDVVSFGVAPAFLVYQMDLHRLEGLGVVVSSLLMVFAGLRLARFNSQLKGFDKAYFVGMPVPMSALTVASYTLNFFSYEAGLWLPAAPFLPWLSVGLGLLMVSKVRYNTLPKPSVATVKKHPFGTVAAGAAIAAIAWTGGRALLPLLLAVILFGVVRYIVEFIRRLRTPGDDYDDTDIAESGQIDR